MVDAPVAKKARRSRKRRKQPLLDLDSSSSSDSEAEAPQRATPVAQAEDAESDSDDSSALFSSSDEEPAQPTRTRKGKQRAVEPEAAVATPAAANGTQVKARPVRRRSPTPPHFGFSARRPGQSFLQGEVPGDGASAKKAVDEDEEFRAFYLAKLVERFEAELQGLQEEANTPDRLELLRQSLAGGADLFLSRTEAKGDREIVLQAMKASKAAQPEEQDVAMDDD